MSIQIFFFGGGDPVYAPDLTPTCEDPVRTSYRCVFKFSGLPNKVRLIPGGRGVGGEQL